MQRKNLTRLQPRWERSSPYCKLSESRFFEMWFLTIDPFAGIPVFTKLSERQYCWRVIEDFHSQEYIQLFDMHCCLFICTSPLAATRFRHGIHSALRSLLLIMCIDAPESTTNSLSSGFHVDEGRHLFSGDEKNVALSCSFHFNTFGQLPRCFAGTLLLPFCFFLRPSSNFKALGLRS